MESVEQHLNKLREERIAREKARIVKLRELNLKKYHSNEPQNIPKPSSNESIANRTRTNSKPKVDIIKRNISKCSSNPVKNSIHINGSSKRVPSAPTCSMKPETKSNIESKPMTRVTDHWNRKTTQNIREKKDFVNSNKIIPKLDFKMPVNKIEPKMTRKSLAPIKLDHQTKLSGKLNIPEVSRKSCILPTKIGEVKSRESVFERLYKPKMVQNKDLSDADRLHKDPVYFQKVVQLGGLITNKRRTVFEPKLTKAAPAHRSISAVHFKRISKEEVGNCIRNWSSIGEKLNEVHLTDINEDVSVKQNMVTSAVKSERKKVHIQTPVGNFNSPSLQELQSRLTKWLKSRGKSIDAYKHLQCFGVHHLSEKALKPFCLPPEPVQFDEEDENKENIALEHDSDNESYTDNMNDRNNDFNNGVKGMWRNRKSNINDSVSPLDTSKNISSNSDEILPVDNLLLGALNDLTELLHEGFDWEQCARWLRSLRERFPHAPSLAAYWEFRAALEERRGDLPASMQCWEEAISKGTLHSLVDAKLDQLLDKFVQLKISPNSGKRERVDPKLVDAKNVFKSTIIRFAVQQAKLRQSSQHDLPKYTVTPVRRSSRLSTHRSARKTPIQVCDSVKQANSFGDKVLFVRNPKLFNTP